MLLLGLLVFGVAIGIVSGLLGIGGGVLLVPGLMLLFGFSQSEAQGTTLAAMIPPIGLFAALVYYRRGDVEFPFAAVVALGFAVGAYFGARLLPHVPLATLRLAFGALLLYVGFMFIVSPSHRTAAALPAGVAAVATTAFGYFLRRGRPPASSNEIDYHI